MQFSSQVFLTVFDRQFHLKELAEIVDRVLTTPQPKAKATLRKSTSLSPAPDSRGPSECLIGVASR
jgi:hypothetical protein